MQAPVVAHANDLVYWDSNNARALVNARGMEYQNHWGAHDPDVELPSEQLNAFFGTRAEYWTPSAAAKGPQRHPVGHAQQPVGHPKHSPAQGQVHKSGKHRSQLMSECSSLTIDSICLCLDMHILSAVDDTVLQQKCSD